MERDDDADARAWRAVGDWYHAAFTGLILATIVHRGTPVAAELVYRVFARQREVRFLDGLRKLGIDALPHAVAAAQYHYLSNDVGGDHRWGGLAAIYRHINQNVKIGVGYSFSDFSSDLGDQSYTSKGYFVNLLGKF